MERRTSWFLIATGIFNVVIWPRFAVAIVKDDRAWDGKAWSSDPTAFFWVHAVLIAVAVFFGLGVLAVGLRGHRASAR